MAGSRSAPSRVLSRARSGDSMSGKPLARERFAAVTVPTLVLVGGTTPWLSDGGRGLAEVLPHGELRTLDGQTHDVAPDVLAPALMDFLSGLRPAGR